jgi:heterodisulfide reductase subunit A-like polyferredoxin
MLYEKGKRYIIPFEDVPSPRAEMPEIPVSERRGNFVEVEVGFPEAVAVQEASRCLSCRRCLGCALCWAECKPGAIDLDIPDEELDLEFDQVILTKGQDNSFETVNSDLGYGRYADVITDLQFERMLSPTGPTQGIVVSPRDGEIPRRMAIIQGHPEENENHLLFTLILGVNESILALSKTENLEVILVSPICESFKKQFLSDTEKISGLRIIDGMPNSVKKKKDEEPLTLTYSEDGQSKEETFDLVVVLTKPKIHPEIKSLSQKLHLDIL